MKCAAKDKGVPCVEYAVDSQVYEEWALCARHLMMAEAILSEVLEDEGSTQDKET